MANSWSVKAVLAGAGALIMASTPWQAQFNLAHAQRRSRPHSTSQQRIPQGRLGPLPIQQKIPITPTMNCAVENHSNLPRSEYSLWNAFVLYDLGVDPSSIVIALEGASVCAAFEENMPLRDQINSFLLAFRENSSTEWPNDLYPLGRG